MYIYKPTQQRLISFYCPIFFSSDDDQQKLSGLESLMETTKQLLEGGGTRQKSSQNSAMMSFNVSIPHFTIVTESGSKHCLFKLCVECRHSQAAVVERWETHRRYRDFYDLHLTLRSEVRYIYYEYIFRGGTSINFTTELAHRYYNCTKLKQLTLFRRSWVRVPAWS